MKKNDQIILLMEGEILAVGTHTELMSTSTEYVQIFNSQQSTSSPVAEVEPAPSHVLHKTLPRIRK